ncbi:MAG: hypothetical protein AAF389_07350 [Gemmatimonadota bacterium]
MSPKRWWLVVAMVFLPTAVAGQASPGEREDGRAVPSAAEVARLTSELAGPWIGPDESGVRDVIGFVDGNAFMGRALAMMEMRLFRSRTDVAEAAASMRETLEGQDLATLSDRLGEVQAARLGARLDLDEAALRAGAAELSASLVQSLREDMELSLVIFTDAITEGDGTLTEVSVSLTRRNDRGDTERPESEIIAYSGDRLYWVDGDDVVVYQRVSSVQGDLLAYWESLRGRRTYDRYLSGEYTRLFRACFELQRQELPLDECRAHRDAMADFGVELQPEGVLERNLDFEKPTPEQMAFWREPTAPSVPQDPIPLLSYCYAGPDSGIPAFLARLAAEEYRGTMWRIAFSSSTPVEKPRNWTDQEFGTLRGGSFQGAMYLREDGVVGLSPLFWPVFHYDPRNRWTYSNGEIVLTLQDGVGHIRLRLGDHTTVPAVLDFALADEASALLVRGDYETLMWMSEAQAHPEYERLLPYTQSQSCPETTATDEPPADPATPTSAAATQSTRPGAAATNAPPPAAPSRVDPPPAEGERPAETVDTGFDERALIGRWLWSNGAQISIADGGTATNGPAQGRWRVDAEAGVYRIEWPIVDRIRIAADGRSFTGTGVAGIEFTGARAAGGAGLTGSWRRQDGVLLEFSADGGASGAGLNGQWTTDSDGTFVVTWRLVDTVTLSADGNELEVENLFGRATATRQPGL